MPDDRVAPIWFKKYELTELNAGSDSTMMGHLGIEITAIGPDYLEGRMPVDERTRQVYGVLHGGASAVLAETLGSIAGMMCVDNERVQVFGVEINANHLKPAKSGYVVGRATPIQVGRTLQVWEIRIRAEDTGQAVCISRLTLAARDKRPG